MTDLFPSTLVDAVLQKNRERPHDVCFFNEETDGWKSYTHSQFLSDIVALARGMKDRGFECGERAAILSRPCYGWEVADKATMYLGGIAVGLEHKATPTDLAHVLRMAAPTCLFVENIDQLSLLPEEILTQMRFIVVFDGAAKDPQKQTCHAFQEILAEFREGPPLDSKASPDNIGVIFFTSGTTGRPKGIPLKHRQLTAGLPLMKKIFSQELSGEHSTLSWIPLHNGTGRMMGTINYFLDVSQYLVRDPFTLFDKIKDVNPTYLVLMPRILEKVYQTLQKKLQERSFASRLYVGGLLTIRQKLPLKWIKNLTDRMLIANLRKAVWGDNLWFLISGSAPVDPKILSFFDTMGIPTFEVYGLSEIGVLVTMNRPGKTRYGSVGLPMDGMNVKLAPDKEVLVKSEVSLENYWGESNSDLYDKNGYLKTGDLAEIKDGYLYIKGRKKEIIKTSTGQRISPLEVESVYGNIPGVDHFVAIGNRRKHLSALIAVDPLFSKSFKGTDRDLIDYLKHEIDKRSKDLMANRQVKKFSVVPKPFSVEEGELTPTLKVRRMAIEEKYSAIIDSMYDEEGR